MMTPRTLQASFRGPSLVCSRLQTTVAAAVANELQEVKPFSAIPSPPAWPIVGHLPIFMKKENQARMHLMFDNLRAEHGDIFKVWGPGSMGTMVATFRPQDIRVMHTNEPHIPILPGFDMHEHIRNTSMKDRYVTSGLINNGEEWYNVRSKVQQDMMRPKSALYYITEMEEIAEELAEKIEALVGPGGGVLDPYRVVQEFALEAVGCVFLGARLGALKGTEDSKFLIDNTTKVNELAQKLLMIPTSIISYLPDYKKFLALQEPLFDICKSHVDTAIANIQEGDDTIIAKLVRRCGKDSFIPAVMGCDALQAGIDTTGTSATFLLYHLADNPEKQQKLYEEICSVIGPNGAMTEGALGKMRYLKACQTESQRMLPAVFGSSRKTQEDHVIGGYSVPKGTTVIKMGQSSSNDPANFSQPDEFIPERWLRGCPEKHSADSFANIPWGHGARACIGRRFAELELYMMMVKVVQRFQLQYTGQKVGVLTKFVSVPDTDVNIRFTKR